MSKKNNENSNNSGGAQSLLSRCPVEKCGKKTDRMNFCEEHYSWFKHGLISKTGEKPKDFDKKYQNYIRRNKPAA